MINGDVDGDVDGGGDDDGGDVDGGVTSERWVNDRSGLQCLPVVLWWCDCILRH